MAALHPSAPAFNCYPIVTHGSGEVAVFILRSFSHPISRPGITKTLLFFSAIFILGGIFLLVIFELITHFFDVLLFST